jgi:hypothetical protein
MKRLGRDAAELTALADHLTAHGLVLEMLAGPLAAIYDATGPGRLLFGFFAAMGRDRAREHPRGHPRRTRCSLPQGEARRPPVITDDMLHTVLRRRANGETVEQIQPDLLIPTGRAKVRTPASQASTGHSPNRRRPRHTPRPSSRPTPTSPRWRLRTTYPGPARPALLPPASSDQIRRPCPR